MATIEQFKGQMAGGGARANQFEVIIQSPIAGLDQNKMYLCTAASLPQSQVDAVTVAFRGREVHFPGDRRFQPWTVQFYNDTDFAIRDVFEKWSNALQQYETTNATTRPGTLAGTLQVFQLDRSGNRIKQYEFVNAFPSLVGGIELRYDATNQIEVFQVDFVYDYFKVYDASGGNAAQTAASVVRNLGGNI